MGDDYHKTNSATMPPLVIKKTTDGDFNCHWSSDPLDFVILTREQIEHLISVAQAALENKT